MHKSIKIGLYDWIKFPQKNNFYPEDLPRQWQLSFFANEFESACLDLSSVTLENELVIEWVEDLPENFELSLVVDLSAQSEQLKEIVEQSDLNLKYLLLNLPNRDILLQNNIHKKVLSQTGISKPDQIIDTASFWRPDARTKSSCIAMFPDIDDKRLYRDWIELWLNNNSQQELTLWLDGANARYSTLNDLRTLVELMGY